MTRASIEWSSPATSHRRLGLKVPNWSWFPLRTQQIFKTTAVHVLHISLTFFEHWKTPPNHPKPSKHIETCLDFCPVAINIAAAECTALQIQRTWRRFLEHAGPQKPSCWDLRPLLCPFFSLSQESIFKAQNVVFESTDWIHSLKRLIISSTYGRYSRTSWRADFQQLVGSSTFVACVPWIFVYFCARSHCPKLHRSSCPAGYGVPFVPCVQVFLDTQDGAIPPHRSRDQSNHPSFRASDWVAHPGAGRDSFSGPTWLSWSDFNVWDG